MDRQLMEKGLATRRAVLMQIAVYCGIPVGVTASVRRRNAFANPK